MTSHAFAQAARTGVVDGPLQGYHREWYVVQPASELAYMGRVKVGEPREGIPWFDRRSFASEEELLLRLPRLGVPHVPPVRRLDSRGPVIHGFIEGEPLNRLAPAGTSVAPVFVDQIMSVIGALAQVRPATVAEWGIGISDDELPRDSAQFLQDLINFTRDEVYAAKLPEFGALFDALGISADALAPESPLASEAAQLTPRPFCLLHADLHRANFIVDPMDRLWTIDWELATVGDPVYELATHLYLMRYPAEQEKRVTEQWRQVIAEVLPTAESGFQADLPRYLGYKRVQSVYTDVVRQAIAVRNCRTPHEREEQLHRTAKTIEGVLNRAVESAGLRSAPGPSAIESAFATFCAGD